ncbi:BapA prefix-like domain-containing protein [Pseudomonas aeruginosa]|uniref:Ig-like domain-containing protein n=1 Tax=Pseudomonas aeruginosa TaxID=287 RepID=UPI0019D4EE18|nr:Ig-like domain-containing protein [Pseudomonas aeruginosa]MBN7866571.1 BapA prefix-like domain-containing protein [Pseudomonas aeruginosa]
MSIQAKVTPIDQSISSAAAVEVPENGILKLSQSSNVALDIAPESVAGYSKSGSDLIVQLKTGESVRIANFYAEGQPSSQLFLADKDKLVAVDLPPVAADGPLMAGYIPQESLAGFESLTGAGVLGGMSAGTALLVGAAAIGAGVAISNSSGGGGGGGSSVPPDTTPPKAASGLKIAPDGSSISGQAEAGASVGIDTNGDGKPDVTVIADANGNFTAPLNPPLTNGQTVTVVVTDPAGNASPPAQVTAPDTTAPAPATDVQVTPGGSSVIGKAEPGSTVGVDTDGDGQPDTTVVVGPDGSFEVPLNPPLTNGETVTVIVTDPAGNNSTPVTVEAPDTTAPAPATDVQVAPDGSSVSGNAEPGATVGVDTDGDGQPDTTVVVGPDGSFEVPLNPPLTNGETVTVIVTDPAGNNSTPVTVEAPDTTAPAPATDVQVAPDGSSVSGNAEPGATVGVDTDGDGQPDTTVVVGPDGSFEVPLNPPLTNGETVTVIVTDPAGNSSTPVTAEAPDFPDAPQVNASNGSVLSGTAEAGVTIVITDGNGNPIGQTSADANGNWSFTPGSQLPDGTVVNVVARDAAGNSSPATSITVDGVAPSAPVVEPSNGSELSGTAEPGSSVTLTDGNGNPIGQTTADANGNWSFTPSTPLPDGTVVNVVARDAAGNSSPPASVTVDAVAPATPTVDPSNGTTLSGTAEPGATVTLTDGNGNPIGQVTADGSGNWSFTPGTPLANGTVVNATATDASGNTSPGSSVTVDSVAPATPVVNPSNGTTLSGTAEPGATVTLTDGNGNPIGQVTADGSGNWSFTPSTPLANGTVVNATATDASGNTSPGSSVTVDSVAPATPVVNPSNGTTLSGTAEPGATVTLTDGNGNPIGQVTADGSGNWSFTPGTPLANGTVVNATASDPTGNTSAPASTTVDSVAPAAPVVNPSNGAEISGSAEPGATVTLTDGSGNPIGQVTADGSGNWSFTPSTPLADGTVVNATATDPAGNTSGQGSTTVDAIAPATPTVNLSNGSSLSGTAEPGSTVILTDGNGNPIAEVTADGSGNWTYTPSTPIANGTVVNVVAQDAAGNSSPPATVTVDSSAPPAPVINPSNGVVISGTAEAGATVTLTDGNGNPIGQATADGSGNWSFTPGTPLANGTVIVATATDPTGNTGPQAATTVDAVAPPAPVVNPSNGATISGTAEAGAKVILTDGSGNPIGETTADGSGNWTFTPATPLANGTVVNAVAQDPAGNTGPQGSTTVDAVAPNTPVVNPSNGNLLNGTAEPGSTVTLTDGNGNPIGQTTADGSGNWSFTPGSQLPNGTVVNVTASDAAGNTSPPATTTVDSSLPSIPQVDPSNGSVISGTADAGNTIIITDGNGNPIGQVTADGSGNWSFTPGIPLPDGTVVNVVARSPSNVDSAPAVITVDGVAPAAPVIDPSNGTEISGTAEAGATVILTDGGGNPIGQATADGSGNWTFTPGTPLANGTVINAVAQDPAGNTSGPASVTVDAIAPPAPVIDPSNGVVISGTAEAGATVILTDGNGNPIGQVTADGSGNWAFTPATPLANGTVINALAQDAAGNNSSPTSAIVDSVAPAAPVIDPSNGSVIAGTAEAGATVILTDGNGNPIGQATADGSGNWSFTPGTPLANGTVVNAVAQDAAGNTSGPASTTVDSVAPAAPVLDPSNGSVIAGTAEAGATVILTDGNGNPIGQATADGSGNWSFTPGTPLANGTVINAVAQDPAGNTSGPTSTTVDAVAPATPVVNPSNGSVIAGTAEAGATVILTDGNGNPIGQATADGSGNWSFTPGTPLANGTVINAVAQDPAGNTSGPASTTVDAVAPATPVLDPSNGTVISGTAEAGATVILTDGNGNPIGQVTADGSGNWSFTPGTPLANGTVINAVAQDPAGNASGPVSTTVDSVAPATPVIDPSNGVELSGTAEPGVRVILTDGNGNPIGQTLADGSGNWTFTPSTPLANGTVVNAVAQDPAGNTSGPASTTVDTVAPATPVINASNGSVITGTAEVGAKVILTDGNGNPIGETTADGSGNWTFTPGTPLPNGTVINAVAEDAAGNASGPASTTVDSVAPSAPLLSISADGALLTGTAEPNSQVRIVVNGDTANPITVTVDGAGNFSLPFAPPLITGELIAGVAVDAAGNVSGPATINAPDLAPPTISVPEAGDTWINAAEIGDGIQVDVTVRPTMQVGQVVTVKFAGQNGYEAEVSHTLTAGDIAAGNVTLTLLPPSGQGPFPEGASTVTADINGGTASNTVSFTVDTVPPPAPVLSLVGNILTISTEPGTEVTVEVNIGGAVATVTLTADNTGLASLDLLTGLDIDLSWDQLLNAQVSVRGEDLAGNPSPVASIGVGTNIPQPVTIGNFGLDVGLLPPTFGFSGDTAPNSGLEVRVVTPAANVTVPLTADASGHFALNLLDPALLLQLGLGSITDLLNLGSQLSFNVVAIDSNGNDSASYGITLSGSGVGLNIGQIDVNGTSGDDVLSGANGSSEHINGSAGSDLIFNVGTGDQVQAGDGNDTIQITATDFVSIDGGNGFDTLLLANGIDLDYNAVGVGTLSNLERIDLGKGDGGSVLTLTAAEVDVITDANNTLQITGESNDTLNVSGAVNTGTTQLINGITYDVYTFGSTTLLIEDNTVQVVV